MASSGSFSVSVAAERDHAQRDDLDQLILERMAIDLLVRVEEALDDRMDITFVERPVWHRGAQLKALADVAALGDGRETVHVGRYAVRSQLFAGFRLQIRDDLVHKFKFVLAGLVRDDKYGARVFVLKLRQKQAHRRRDAGMQRRDGILGADQLRQRGRVQRAGAAKTHQREMARIDALGDRVSIDGQRHIVVDHPQNSERGVRRR